MNLAIFQKHFSELYDTKKIIHVFKKEKKYIDKHLQVFKKKKVFAELYSINIGIHYKKIENVVYT